VVGEARSNDASYLLVQLSPEIATRIGQRRASGLSTLGNPGPSPQTMLGIGDVVSVTIFEAAAGGLFIPATSGARPGNFVTLPDQSVDNAGNITMPYAGTIPAAGRGIPEIQADIVDRLGDRAIEPQVVVTLKEQQATQVSVIGAVRSAGRFPISAAGDRVLDAIAKAGGPQYPAYETYVTLQRGRKEGTEHLSGIINHPADNVYVRAGDTIIVSRKPETFVALGASGRNGQFDFEAENVTLAEAFGKAGGLLDARANATHVFLYRVEEAETLGLIGYGDAVRPGTRVPTIYSVDVRDPAGYFIATQFDVQDKDILYIANAASVDISKVFSFIREASATVRETDNVMN
jgi:polysaccharide export outer membrane protein